MLYMLLLLAILFQGHTQPAAIIDNDRVTVRETMTQLAAPLAVDSVLIPLSRSKSGTAEFINKGTLPKISGTSVLIELKDHPVASIANPTRYPLAFPRPGSKKLIENDAVVVWDYTWAPGVATPMHFHDKDVVVVYLEDGDLQSTTPDGKVTVNSFKFGDVKFNLRDRTHTETLVGGKQHAIITELK